MLLFRWLVFLLLLGAGVCFMFYVATGQSRYRRWGLVVVSVVMMLGACCHKGPIVIIPLPLSQEKPDDCPANSGVSADFGARGQKPNACLGVDGRPPSRYQ